MAGESASLYSPCRISQDDQDGVAPTPYGSVSVQDSQDSQGSSIEDVIDWAKEASKHDAQKPPLPACLVHAVESTAENLVLSANTAPPPRCPVGGPLALVAHHDAMPAPSPGFVVPPHAKERSADGPEVHKAEADDEVKVNIVVDIDKFQSNHEYHQYHMHHHHYHYHTHHHEKPTRGGQDERGDKDADGHDSSSDDYVASGEDEHTHVTILRSVTVTPLSSGRAVGIWDICNIRTGEVT